MNDGGRIRVVGVALLAAALIACRTIEPATDVPESTVAQNPPELSLEAPYAVEEGFVSRDALVRPAPPRPEPSLAPSRPADGAFVAVLALPGVASAVTPGDEETRDGADDAEVRAPSIPESIDTAPIAATSARDTGGRASAIRPAPVETRTNPVTTTSADASTGTTADTDDNPAPAPHGTASPSNVGDRSTERDDAISTSEVTRSGPSPTTERRRGEALAVSDDTEMTRSVRPGDLFVVQLPGPSWIFVGPTDGVEFVDRRAVATGVEFMFRLRESEDGRPVALRFESQDLADGRRRIHTETIESSDGIGLADRDTPGDGDPFRGVGSQSDSTERSPGTASLSDGDLAPDTEAIIEALGSGEFGTLGITEEDLRNRVTLLEERAEHDHRARLLEAMLDAGVVEGDWILYTLAQLLESPWDGRDIRRARALYRRLVDEYPFSFYWDAAEERIEFLNRHFFDIR